MKEYSKSEFGVAGGQVYSSWDGYLKNLVDLS